MTPTPILSLKENANSKKMTANLLPCRIHHDGPVDPVNAYWRPMTNADNNNNNNNNNKQAYFRGRGLQGMTLSLPDRYRGLVVERTADELKKAPQPPTESVQDDVAGDDDVVAGDDDVVALETLGTMQAVGEFDEMVIWSHESMATATADPYVRSINEWLQMSEKIHDFRDKTSDDKAK